MKKQKILKKCITVISILALILAFSACGSRGEAQPEENPLDAGSYDEDGNFIQLAWYPSADMNDLKDEDWETEDGFMVYKGSGYNSYKAIDVSSNQDVIDWDKVKAAGVEYAIMRAGYRTYGSGIIKTDECFYWNMKQAKKAGVKTGVYFFSQAISEEEAEEEAQFVLDMLSCFETDLPIYYDTEQITYDTARTDSLTGEELTANALAFCEYIQNAGYTPGIYGNQMWLCNTLDLLQLQKYDIWLAKYAEELNYPYEIQAWQFSSEGHVDGIGPAVDLDVILERR